MLHPRSQLVRVNSHRRHRRAIVLTIVAPATSLNAESNQVLKIALQFVFFSFTLPGYLRAALDNQPRLAILGWQH